MALHLSSWLAVAGFDDKGGGLYIHSRLGSCILQLCYDVWKVRMLSSWGRFIGHHLRHEIQKLHDLSSVFSFISQQHLKLLIKILSRDIIAECRYKTKNCHHWRDNDLKICLYTAEEFLFDVYVCILMTVCFWLVIVVEEKGSGTSTCPKICQLLKLLWSESDLSASWIK